MTPEPETPKPAAHEEAQLALARAMYAAADAVEAASRVVRHEAQQPVEGFGNPKP